jgi:hypothetical protein
MKNLPLLFLIMMITTSCGVSTGLQRTAYQQQIAQTPIIQSPLVAEIEADPTKKVKASFVYKKEGDTDFRVRMAKEAALHGAMLQNGCDVILQPLYEVEYNEIEVNASVQGICGVYKVLRKPTLEDITILQELKTAMPMFDSAITEIGVWGTEVR